MYKNLEAEMTRIGIDRGDLAKAMGVGYNTVIRKLKGSSKFTLDEIEDIRDSFFPNYTIEYLFLEGQKHEKSS